MRNIQLAFLGNFRLALTSCGAARRPLSRAATASGSAQCRRALNAARHRRCGRGAARSTAAANSGHDASGHAARCRGRMLHKARCFHSLREWRGFVQSTLLAVRLISFRISCSMRRTILDGATFSTAAIPTSTRIVGLLIPRSIRLMYVRSNPPSRANRSWEICLLFRISRSACPNAFSGP